MFKDIFDFGIHGIVIVWSFLFSIDFTKSLTVVKDIVTIVGVIAGLYLGNKSLKKYLLNEYVKKKVEALTEANHEVARFTREIVSEIEMSQFGEEVVTLGDFDNIIEKAFILNKLTLLASAEISTVSYYFVHTLKKSREEFKITSIPDFILKEQVFTLFYNYLLLQNELSSNIVFLPEKVQIEPYHTRFKVGGSAPFQDRYYRISGMQFGLHLQNDFSLKVRFIEVLYSFNANHLFHRSFYGLLKDNSPILFVLDHMKLYFPLKLHIISSDVSKALSGQKEMFLLLVKFEKFEHFIGDTPPTVVVYYSNFSQLHFVDNFTPDKIDKNYIHPLEPFVDMFESNPKIEKIKPETIKITYPLKYAEDNYIQFQKLILKKLALLSKTDDN